MKNISKLSPLPGRPDTILSGKGTARHTGTALGLVQGRMDGLLCSTHEEIQMQILHPARNSEGRPHHQAQTLQTQADILRRPMCTTHLTPRFHPMGGSYTKIAQKGHDNEREFNHIDVQAVADTTPKTTEQPQGELLAAGCGRMAEFLAQAPRDEEREGLRQRSLKSSNACTHSTTSVAT